MKVDLTVAAIPAFIGAMGAEYAWQRRQAKARAAAGPDDTSFRPGEYELADTLASLSMGIGSLAAPFVAKKLLDPLTPGKGRLGPALMATAVAATAATTVADVVRRRKRAGRLPEAGTLPEPGALDAPQESQARLYGTAAATAVASTALAAATTWSAQTSGSKLFDAHKRDLGGGALATAVGLLGWDFIYYWNHRLSHESRWLWAVHVVHHSSERYNLSTALRQPVAEGVTLTVPYGLLALLGVRPSIIENARALNLIYQFWIHTEAINKTGWVERWFNTPSHHRVHHGSQSQYLDRNHGSILIIWDRLFGTFEVEQERVVYGLTKNIDSFNLVKIAGHEWRDIWRDIASATTWRDRWSYLLRGPGWAYSRHSEAALAA